MGVYVSLNISILVKLSFHNILNHIGPVIVSLLASSAVHRGLERWSVQTKDYIISIYYFSTKYTAVRSTNKDWLDSESG